MPNKLVSYIINIAKKISLTGVERYRFVLILYCMLPFPAGHITSAILNAETLVFVVLY